MSQETVERVYTINLGKVLLSPNNQRAKRAINMIREFAIRHMKSEDVKIEEDVSHLVWARGIRHPPRKIRVKLTKDDDGVVLISKYQEEKPKKEEIVEKKPKAQKTEKVEEKSEAKTEKSEIKPTKSEIKPEKKSETKEKPKTEAKSIKPKKEEKSEKKTEEKTKTKSETKPKKK